MRGQPGEVVKSNEGAAEKASEGTSRTSAGLGKVGLGRRVAIVMVERVNAGKIGQASQGESERDCDVVKSPVVVMSSKWLLKENRINKVKPDRGSASVGVNCRNTREKWVTTSP